MADDDDLDLLFTAARRQDAPSADLRERVLAVATAMQPLPAAPALMMTSGRPTPGPGFWQEVWQTLGGWRATGGLSAAMLLGFWLGLSDPSGLLGQLGGADSVELMPGTEEVFAGLADEG